MVVAHTGSVRAAAAASATCPWRSSVYESSGWQRPCSPSIVQLVDYDTAQPQPAALCVRDLAPPSEDDYADADGGVEGADGADGTVGADAADGADCDAEMGDYEDIHAAAAAHRAVCRRYARRRVARGR